MSIDQIPEYTGEVPVIGQEQNEFNTNTKDQLDFFNQQAVNINMFATQANALGDSVEVSEQNAASSAAAAASNANFAGNWSDATGVSNRPVSYRHNGRNWQQLAETIPDITLNEPQENAFWTELSNVVITDIINPNLISNSGFEIAGSVTNPPDATPRSYNAGDEIFAGHFAVGPLSGVTYVNGLLNGTSQLYTDIYKTEKQKDSTSDFTPSIAGSNGNPYETGVTVVDNGDYWRVTFDMTNTFSVKLEQGAVATGHDVGALSSRNLPEYTNIVYKASGGNSAIENMILGFPVQASAGDKLSTGVTSWLVISNSTAKSIAIAGGLFAIALNGIWPTDAGASVNGVDDDQPAIQYCVDLKSAPVILTNGDWILGSEVVYYDRTSIRGLSKESVRVRHPNSSVAFKSESFNVPNTDTTRFEIGRISFIGGWDNRPSSENLIPQSAIYAKGYDYNIHDIDLEQYGDVGIYATSTEPTDLIQANEHIESYISKIKASKCYSGGVYLESPTDSFIKDVVVISLGDDDWGNTNYSPTNFGIKTGAGAGATIASNCHCYGYMQYTYNINGGSTRLYDCIGEGGILGQVYVGVDGVQISRGRYFSGYNADGTSIRTVNQGIVVAENVKDCKFETDIFFCNEGGVVFLGAGSGGNNIVDCVIYATGNSGQASIPVQIVGATSLTDTFTLKYQQSSFNKVPSGVAPQLTTNGSETSTFGQLTLGASSQSKAGDKNIFSIVRDGVGEFTIQFTRPYSTSTYIVSPGVLSDHYVKVISKSTNQLTIKTLSMPSYTVSDEAIIDIKITGFVG